MAVKSLKKGYLALAASMLLVAQAQATDGAAEQLL